MVVAQLIFFVAMISTVMFVSANLYLMQATSTEEIEDAESEPWQMLRPTCKNKIFTKPKKVEKLVI